ncbi:MAG: heat shock protein HspQ [Proteobacteria bacterium]|nr:heat shock protein HspQ [Pseudomonadota bacterium]
MAKFQSGQIVHHKRFGYRGVVVSVDQTFQGTEEWYQQVARSRPPKDNPWYHVLVHDSNAETYVAERHLELDESEEPIEHPLVSMFFDELRDGRYIRDRLLN